MSQVGLSIEARDPLSGEALFLLHKAALEARELYQDLVDPATPMPTNQPLRDGDTYLIAFLDGNPVGCGALRKLDDRTAEVRRMYVLRRAGRAGTGRAMLVRLEDEAARLGYEMLLLETGNRQGPAMALYESYGFTRIPPFGPYINDPTSVCYSKQVEGQFPSPKGGVGLCPDLSAVVQDDEGGRGHRSQPGVLTPGNRFRKVRHNGAAGWSLPTRRRTNSGTDNLPPLQHPQPRGCGVQYGLRAVLQHSASPIPLCEHEDEHSLSDVAPRFALPPAQNRPRKRGTLHKKNVGEVGSTRTILMRLVRAGS